VNAAVEVWVAEKVVFTKNDVSDPVRLEALIAAVKSADGAA